MMHTKYFLVYDDQHAMLISNDRPEFHRMFSRFDFSSNEDLTTLEAIKQEARTEIGREPEIEQLHWTDYFMGANHQS